MTNKKFIKWICLFGFCTMVFSGCGQKTATDGEPQKVAAVDEKAQTAIDEAEAEKYADDQNADVQSFFDGTDDTMNSNQEVSEDPVVTDDEEAEVEAETENDTQSDELSYEDIEVVDAEEDGLEDLEDIPDIDAEADILNTTVKLDVSSSLTGKHHVSMVLKDYGTIEIELDADAAPITVTNFVKLVQEGFYDGLTFHRIVPGFIVQGGDPDGDGTGGSKDTIKGEFASNGIENTISHKKGVISMARTSIADSASSQFFIMLEDKSDFLDGEYAAFGRVTSGMECVEKMAEEAVITDSNGTVPKENQPSIESAIVID